MSKIQSTITVQHGSRIVQISAPLAAWTRGEKATYIAGATAVLQRLEASRAGQRERELLGVAAPRP